MTDSSIAERFKELPDSYRSFVASAYPREVAEVFAPSLNLTPPQIDTLEDGLILYLLFFLNESELVEYVLENTGANVTDTNAVISTICRNLPEFANHDAYEEARLETAMENSSLNLEIAETESAIRSIDGLRTMAGDASAVTQAPETTYQSSQAEILTRPIAPLAATPPPPQNDDNRWSSES